MATTNLSTRDTDLTLVIGGTGKTGRRVADRLIADGRAVRIGSRSADPAFDWNDRATWSPALEGVTSVYISFHPDLAVPAAPPAIQALTDLSREMGVQRLVLLSGRGEVEAQRCEQMVLNCGIPATVVRAAWFNQNFSEGPFLNLVLSGTVALPAGDVPEPFVDADDIADVAVAALTEPGHAGEIYEVTGPRLMTFTETISEIAAASGRALQFVQITPEQFERGLDDTGLPAEMIGLFVYLFREVLDGRNAHVGDGVQRALGRPSHDFRDYAVRTAAAGVWNEEVPA